MFAELGIKGEWVLVDDLGGEKLELEKRMIAVA